MTSLVCNQWKLEGPCALRRTLCLRYFGIDFNKNLIILVLNLFESEVKGENGESVTCAWSPSSGTPCPLTGYILMANYLCHTPGTVCPLFMSLHQPSMPYSSSEESHTNVEHNGGCLNSCMEVPLWPAFSSHPQFRYLAHTCSEFAIS